jgi:hypothetical protein
MHHYPRSPKHDMQILKKNHAQLIVTRLSLVMIVVVVFHDWSMVMCQF